MHPPVFISGWPEWRSSTIRSWICPKCDRVYTDQIMTCYHCNNKILQEENGIPKDVWDEIKRALANNDRREVCRLMGWNYDKILEEFAKEKG